MLKGGSKEDQTAYFNKLKKEAEIMVKSVGELAYYMRGALQYDHIMLRMSRGEREVLESFINKRLEQEMKSPHPVY